MLNAFSYPSESFISTSRRVFINQNSFTGNWQNKKATSIHLVKTLDKGQISVAINLSDYLLGYDNLLYLNVNVEGLREFSYNYDALTGNLVVTLDSPTSASHKVYVNVVSYAEFLE